MMFAGDDCFSAPAYPCDSVFDPRAREIRSPAALWVTWPTATSERAQREARRHIRNGHGFFLRRGFSVKGMSSLNIDAIKRRFKDLKEVSHFDM